MSKVTDCPKCRNPRESSRWPFCFAAGSGEDKFNLKVECARCGYSWIEPSADARVKLPSGDTDEDVKIKGVARL